MRTVYVIWYDNGEDWEDHYACPLYAFPTGEMAEEYLDKNLEVKTESKAHGNGYSPYTWSHEHTTCEKYDDCFDCPLYQSGIESESGHVECDTYHKKEKDWWDNSFWYYSSLTIYDSSEEAMDDENAYL